jgi:hypothetical protein
VNQVLTHGSRQRALNITVVTLCKIIVRGVAGA